MGKVVAKNVIERKKGYLYYVDANGSVCEAKMARGGRRKSTARKTTTARRTTARRSTARKTTTARRTTARRKR